MVGGVAEASWDIETIPGEEGGEMVGIRDVGIRISWIGTRRQK